MGSWDASWNDSLNSFLTIEPEGPSLAPHPLPRISAVGWMVSHEVKMVSGGEPGGDSSSFATIQARVKISGYIGINLGVQSREEPPVHGKYLVDVSRRWNVADIADVQAGVAACQAAELFQDRVAGGKVVIDTDCPSWVVRGE